MLYEHRGHISFQLLFSFSSDKHSELELLNHMTVLFLIFWVTSMLFFIVVSPIYIPTTVHKGSLFSTSLPAASINYFLSFLMITVLTGVRWFWLTFPRWLVILTIFSCVLGKKCLFRSSTNFLIGLFFDIELFQLKFHGQRSLVGYSPWGCKELDTTEQLHFHFIYFGY